MPAHVELGANLLTIQCRHETTGSAGKSFRYRLLRDALALAEVRNSWREPTSLFTVVTLPPGSRKSAVFAAMAHCLPLKRRR
ncbi:hypothetical protein J2S41_006729 [Catenuloplanes atrovinosus]|uniref:Uncharacterized protein n=1 Tax=Catenuloplanes atrovinosus TaxID=137266 RepID=A0AAE3YXU4_9ACTN|nr:hypothetical protein [Catenuloplanes atrovinosus]